MPANSLVAGMARSYNFSYTVYIKKRETAAASKGQASSALLSTRCNTGIRKLYFSNRS